MPRNRSAKPVAEKVPTKPAATAGFGVEVNWYRASGGQTCHQRCCCFRRRSRIVARGVGKSSRESNWAACLNNWWTGRWDVALRKQAALAGVQVALGVSTPVAPDTGRERFAMSPFLLCQHFLVFASPPFPPLPAPLSPPPLSPAPAPPCQAPCPLTTSASPEPRFAAGV
jgi:hypothetical protein|tara:strand:+ start:1067 stop:1576 length:510 start_codon:yes stop_codon:yes gene_type:complete